MQIGDGKYTAKNTDGFSIVELALVLIIFGMVISTVMLGYKYYTTRSQANTTAESFNEVGTALFEFQVQQGRYPCPARLNASPADADYGVERCDLVTYAPLAGIDIVPGRDVDGDGDIENAYIGGVPFKSLIDPNNDGDFTDSPYPDFTEKNAFDFWGNKKTYVISAPLTNPLTFHQDNGVINVIDESDVSLLEVTGTAQALIISHGPNGKGAYSRAGNLVENCAVGIQKQEDQDNGISTPPDETENCQFLNATFLNGLRNDTNYNYYDDTVKVILSKKSSLWEYTNVAYDDKGTEDPSDDVFINQVANTNGGYVGVGTDTPTQKLQVEGDIQAFGIHAEKLCDQGGEDCLLPEAIAGELEDMSCADGLVITEIEKNTVTCENPFKNAISGTCPNGTNFVGVSSKSGLICE